MSKVQENMKAVVTSIILITLCVGINGLKKLRDATLAAFEALKSWLNIVFITLNDGKGLIPTLLTHYITYYIVGVMLSAIIVSRKTKSVIGKVCYSLVSGAILPLLIWINNRIFG